MARDDEAHQGVGLRVPRFRDLCGEADKLFGQRLAVVEREQEALRRRVERLEQPGRIVDVEVETGSLLTDGGK